MQHNIVYVRQKLSGEMGEIDGEEAEEKKKTVCDFSISFFVVASCYSFSASGLTPCRRRRRRHLFASYMTLDFLWRLCEPSVLCVSVCLVP